MFDLQNEVACATLLAPGALLTTTPSVTVFDLANFKSCKVRVAVGVGGITFTGANRIDLVVEHSDDNVTYAPVIASDLQGITTAAGVTGTLAAGGIVRSYQAASAAATNTDFGYRRTRRFLRVTPTFVGTHATGTAVVVIGMGGDPVNRPAVAVN